METYYLRVLGIGSPPVLLNWFLVAAVRTAVYTLDNVDNAQDDSLKKPLNNVLDPLYERVQWQQQLRSISGPPEKEIADDVAIGGLRNTAETVSRLSYSAEFGITL